MTDEARPKYPLLLGDITPEGGVIRLTQADLVDEDGTERMIYASPGGSCMPVSYYVGALPCVRSGKVDFRVRVKAGRGE